MEFSDAEYQAEEASYKRGVIDTLNIVSKWLDEETIDAVREKLLNEG